MKGYIHSFQSMGAVDGPGLRYVVFMQGCPLRCAYCHNPDTWQTGQAETFETDQVITKALRFLPYFKNGGGVTVSGGEALLQWEFVSDLFEKLQGRQIHTALDTSGIGSLQGAAAIFNHTNLVICDLKFPSEQQYQEHCHGSLNQVTDFLSLTQEKKIPLWVRHVVIPGLTDTPQTISTIVSLATRYANLEKIELLPFRKLCLPKYHQLGIPFPLEATPECPQKTIETLKPLIPQNLQ